MNKSLNTKLALLLLAFACAPCAPAQEPAAKPSEAVRERRATEAQKSAQPTATNTKSAEPSSNEKAATETAEASTSAESQGPSADDASQSPAERARQRQTEAEQLAASGNKTEAVALLRSMLAEERFDPAFFYNTGNALARMGESESAVEAYRKAVAQRRGNYARAQHNLGVVLTRLGRWEEAEEALTAALKLESFTYAEASYSLGRLHALRGESGLAITEWARTLKLKPDHADAAVALARLLAEGGDTPQALAVLDALGERLSRRGLEAPREIAVARGEIVAASNVVEDSNARVVTIPRADEGGADSKEAGGETVLVKSKVVGDADASAVLRNARAASTKPLVANAAALDLLRRARAAREGGRDTEAVALYRRAVESNGGYFAPANLEMGYTLASLRRNEDAAASVLSVIKREGTRFPIAFYHVARFYEHMNRLAEAEEAFARAAELMGDRSPQFYVDLSRVRERAGNLAGALAAAEEYVRLSARNGSAPDWARARVEQLRKKTAAVTEP
ncbi:MAG TPA: tetratricopeptide repeat protein [Pyrinomonadaceae bacterium]|jgi:tetratricopeptide (TPR) repeat protein|nr:tetratricopeptide repeat protein [Pyrinomonadaceae bacterium]